MDVNKWLTDGDGGGKDPAEDDIDLERGLGQV